ncbi:MAG: gliding motility lipoprotein GldD [Bacteroidota bacterium]
MSKQTTIGSLGRCNLLYWFAVFLLAGLFSCGGADGVTPRPPGYFRIDLPSKEYIRYEGECPYRFVYPAYSVVEPGHGSRPEPCWIDINYKQFKARLYLSYKPVNRNLDSLLEQSRHMAVQHQVKANAMRESPVINDSARVYGLIYEFGGNTASSLQFYLTDSTRHFMRGALYFYARPNADSLAPVYEFLKEDIFKMIETFEWKE